jgi:hypothetical protein
VSLYFFVFTILFLSLSHATDVETEIENSNSVSLGINYFSQNSAPADQAEYEVLFLSENKFYFSKSWSSKISPLMLTTYGSSEKKQRAELDVKEARFTYADSWFTADIGFLNTKKVGPDLIDPLDYFQPRDWQNPLASRKLSVPGLQIEFEPLKNLSVAATYIPKNRLSKLPRQTSLWYPREYKLPLSTDDTKATLPENPEYQITSSAAEKESDTQNNYLIRLKYSITDFDLYLQFSECLSNTPIITPTLTGTLISLNPTEIVLQNPVQLDVMWKKNKNAGAGIVKSFSSYSLITKLFYNLNITPDDENKQTVAAIEKQFDDVVFIYEMSRSQKKTIASGSSLTATNSIFSNAHALAARWSYSDNLKLKFGAFLDANNQSTAFLGNLEYHISDNIFVELQRTELSGGKDALIGLFQNNDQTSFKITGLF